MNKFVEIKDKKQLDEFMDHIWNFNDAVITKLILFKAKKTRKCLSYQAVS